MQVSVESSGAIERRLKVSVPADRVQGQIDRELRDLAGRVKLPGFRKGKVPRKLLEQRYLPEVRQSVVSKTIEETYGEALTEEKLTPAGLLSLEPEPYVDGQDLTYVATIEVFPEVELPSLAGRTLKVPTCEIQDADVDQTLDTIRSRNTEFVPKPDKQAAEEGDRVIMDFVGTVDGEEFPGGKADDFPCVLGQGQMLPDFEKALSSVKAGDTPTANVTFPDEYHAKELAGKRAKFEIRVKRIEAPRLPDVDDAFAARMGVEGGVKRLREEVRGNMQRELTQRLRMVKRVQVLEALSELVPPELPKTLIRQELESAGQSAEKPSEEARKEAERRVGVSLLCREVITGKELEVSDTEVRARIEEQADAYNDPQQFITEFYAKPGQISQLESMLLEEKVIDSMAETAKIKAVEQSFRDVMDGKALEDEGKGKAKPKAKAKPKPKAAAKPKAAPKPKPKPKPKAAAKPKPKAKAKSKPKT